MDTEAIIRSAASRAWLAHIEASRAAGRLARGDVVLETASPYIADVRGILTARDIGIADVELATGPAKRGRSSKDVDLRVVFDEGWEPLDEGWKPADTIATMFNALETAGYRHVPGTSGFAEDGGSTVFVKDGLTFNFLPSGPPEY